MKITVDYNKPDEEKLMIISAQYPGDFAIRVLLMME